jgi:flagellar basal body-associated protein FliL
VLDEVSQLMGQMERDGAGAIEDLYFTNFAVQQR